MLTPMSLRRVLPWLAALVWLLAIAAVVVAVSGGDLFYPSLVAMPGYGTVGALLGIRRPTHPIGWLLLAMGALPAFAGLMKSPEVINGLALVCLAVVLVLFPTGRPLTRRWWIPIAAVVASWVFVWTLPLIGLASGLEIPPGVVAAVVSLFVCAAAPIIRFRRSSGIERAQLRWLGAAVAASALAVLLVAVGFAFGQKSLVETAGSFAAMLLAFGLPIAMMIAILRYRLFEIGKIVSRTVTYSVVALLVAVVYAVPVLAAPRILGDSNQVVIAGSTLTAAVAFSPLRRRVRRVVDRRFNRSAYDAAREVERFADGVRDEVDPEAITDRLRAVVQSTLHPSSLAVWMQRQG